MFFSNAPKSSEKIGFACVRILLTNVKKEQHCNGRIPQRLNFCRRGLFRPPRIARFFRSIKTSLKIILSLLLVKANYIACTVRSRSLDVAATFPLDASEQTIASLTVKSFRMCLNGDFLIDNRSLVSLDYRRSPHMKFTGYQKSKDGKNISAPSGTLWRFLFTALMNARLQTGSLHSSP